MRAAASVAVSAVLLLALRLSTATFDYCLLCNPPQNHTLCKYPNADAVEPCTSKPIDSNTSDKLLQLHNKWRDEVARGKGKQPPAKDMHELVWDATLSAIAQRWANQCILGHDECRHSPFTNSAGQNFGEMESSTGVLEKIATTWFNEVQHMKPENVSIYKPNPRTDNYTQMMWSRTRALGCGAVELTRENQRRTRLFCNYEKAGNVEWKPVYKQGAARASCVDGGPVKDKYPGLCTFRDYRQEERKMTAAEARGNAVDTTALYIIALITLLNTV